MEQHDWPYYAWVGGCVALAFFIRYRRLGKARPLRLGTLWIVPTIFLAFAATLFVQYPPSGLGWLWVALGFAAGGAIGWYRARWIEIGADPATGQLNQRSSPGALIFLAGLVAVRWLLRSMVMLGDARWHFGAMLIGDIFIAMAAGVLVLYRIEIFLRARRILTAFNQER